MVAQHIHDADSGESHAGQIRTLSHRRTDKEATIRTTGNSQIFTRRIIFPNEVFCSSNKIIEDILLLHFCPGFMPFLTVLTSTAKIRLSIDTALFEPRHTESTEVRCQVDIESSICIEICRV